MGRRGRCPCSARSRGSVCRLVLARLDGALGPDQLGRRLAGAGRPRRRRRCGLVSPRRSRCRCSSRGTRRTRLGSGRSSSRGPGRLLCPAAGWLNIAPGDIRQVERLHPRGTRRDDERRPDRTRPTQLGVAGVGQVEAGAGVGAIGGASGRRAGPPAQRARGTPKRSTGPAPACSTAGSSRRGAWAVTRVSGRRRTAVSSPKYSSRSSTWRPIASNQASARWGAAGEPLVRPRSQTGSRGVEAGLGAADLAPGEEHRLVQRLGLRRHVLGGVPVDASASSWALPAEAGSAGPRSKPGVVGRGGAAGAPPRRRPRVAEHDEGRARGGNRGAERHQRRGRRAPGRDVPVWSPESISWFYHRPAGGRAAAASASGNRRSARVLVTGLTTLWTRRR